MANEIINPELVAKIEEISAQWIESKRALDAVKMPAWAKRATRGGLEYGAMLQIGKVTPDTVVQEMGLGNEGRFEAIGEAVFKAYKSGLVVIAMDSIQ